MNRRRFMTATASLAATAMLPKTSVAQTVKKSATVELVPVTYLQTPMQLQFQRNIESLKNKPYQDFFNGELRVPMEMVKGLYQPLPADQVFAPTAEALNEALENIDNAPVSGYGVINDGEKGIAAFSRSRHFMPNVTSEMFKWWMLWHTVEKERYMLWFPQAHINNSLADPERAADKSLSYEARFYNNPNHITEYIGDTLLDTIAVFVPPEQIGFRSEVLKAKNITASASGWSHPVGADNVAMATLIHLVRDVEGGAELISFYWTTPHAELSRIAKIKGAGERGVQAMSAHLTEEKALAIAYEMSVHDMTEFTHLAEILPELYAQFGQL